MEFTSYRLHRRHWLIWRWVADYRGEKSGKGYALNEACARWAARSWLRAQSGTIPAPEARTGEETGLVGSP